MREHSVNRRDFFRGAAAVGATIGAASRSKADPSKSSSGRVIGANDRINVGVIGVGGSGS